MIFNQEECPYYKYNGYGKCTLADQNEEYSYDCEENSGNHFRHGTLCSVRKEYYKQHPETYIQFGKYKYMKYKDIPYDYVAWLLNQDLKPELREVLENAIIENKIEEIKENKETVIKDFIDEHYNTYRYHKSSRNRYVHSTSGCPEWLDYGGDVFDAMQGCGINGD